MVNNSQVCYDLCATCLTVAIRVVNEEEADEQ